MANEDSPEQFDFVLEYESAVLRTIRAEASNPQVKGWSTECSERGWQIEFILHSPTQHSGRHVALQTNVPSTGSDLGMDLETYIVVQSSGIVERFLTRTPDVDPHIRYTS